METSRDKPDVLMEKAREDQYLLELAAPDGRVSDSLLGFHAQQAVEKALKAVLARNHVGFARVHNIVYLLALLNEARIAQPPNPDVLKRLTPFAVDYRYGELLTDSPEPLDRSLTIEVVRRVLDWAAPLIR